MSNCLIILGVFKGQTDCAQMDESVRESGDSSNEGSLSAILKSEANWSHPMMRKQHKSTSLE